MKFEKISHPKNKNDSALKSFLPKFYWKEVSE
jgi:hypothetical protein